MRDAERRTFNFSPRKRG